MDSSHLLLQTPQPISILGLPLHRDGIQSLTQMQLRIRIQVLSTNSPQCYLLRNPSTPTQQVFPSLCIKLPQNLLLCPLILIIFMESPNHTYLRVHRRPKDTFTTQATQGLNLFSSTRLQPLPTS